MTTLEATTNRNVQGNVMRVLGTASLAGVALVHLLDLPGKLQETPYLGFLYILLIVGCVVAGWMIARTGSRSGWSLGGALALGALVAYALSRTVGLPYATDDIGNWLEPLGVLSLIFEGVVVALSAVVLTRRSRQGGA